jgi:hypothetical protein
MVRGSPPSNVVTCAMFDAHASRPKMERVVFEVRTDQDNMDRKREALEQAVAKATAQMCADKGEDADACLWLHNNINGRFTTASFLFSPALADAWRARAPGGRADLTDLEVRGVDEVAVSFPERAYPKEFLMLKVPQELTAPGLLTMLKTMGHKVVAVEPATRVKGLELPFAQAGAFHITVEPGSPFPRQLEFAARDGKPGRVCEIHRRSPLPVAAPGTWAAIVARQPPAGGQRPGGPKRPKGDASKTLEVRKEGGSIIRVTPPAAAGPPQPGAPAGAPEQALVEEAPAAEAADPLVPGSTVPAPSDAEKVPEEPLQGPPLATEPAPEEPPPQLSAEEILAAAKATYAAASARSMDLRLAKINAEDDTPAEAQAAAEAAAAAAAEELAAATAVQAAAEALVAEREAQAAQAPASAAAAAQLAVEDARREALVASETLWNLDGSRCRREGCESSDEEPAGSDMDAEDACPPGAMAPASGGDGADALCASDEEVVAVATAGKRSKVIVPIMRDAEGADAQGAEAGIDGSEAGGAGGAAIHQNA